MTKKQEKKNQKPVVRKRINTKPSERGLSADGGAWNIAQAAAWSAIGETSLREMAKARQIPCLFVGRRIVLPRAAFQTWFNSRTNDAA
jgi:hypothetical protein